MLCRRRVENRPNIRHLHGSEMRDVHDSPGWRNLYGNEQYPYNLVFGIYIDWFQVFGMRIAGE